MWNSKLVIFTYIDLSLNYINFINVQAKRIYAKMLETKHDIAMAWLPAYAETGTLI